MKGPVAHVMIPGFVGPHVVRVTNGRPGVHVRGRAVMRRGGPVAFLATLPPTVPEFRGAGRTFRLRLRHVGRGGALILDADPVDAGPDATA